MLTTIKVEKSKKNTNLENIDSLLRKYVRVKTYLSMHPIYGEILEATESTITVVPEYIGEFDEVNYDKVMTYLLPKSSLIEVTEVK